MRASVTLALLSAGLVSAKYIVPGARWYDTEGKIVTNHAGGITREEGTGKFYWFGERKVEGQVEGGLPLPAYPQPEISDISEYRWWR